MIQTKVTNNNKANQFIQPMVCRERQLSLDKVHLGLTKDILNHHSILSFKGQLEMLNTFKMETKPVQIKACRELRHSPHLKSRDNQIKCHFKLLRLKETDLMTMVTLTLQKTVKDLEHLLKIITKTSRLLSTIIPCNILTTTQI